MSSSTQESHLHKYAICATSQVPPPTDTSSSSTDAIQTICPSTGSLLTTATTTTTTHTASSSSSQHCLRLGSSVGVQSFQSLNVHSIPTGMYFAYVKDRSGNNDSGSGGGSYLHLLTPNTTDRWKCRLPESMSGGIVPSPCGRYVIGGGNSGHAYIWSTFGSSFPSPPSHSHSSVTTDGTPIGGGGGGGELLRVWKAHYRRITTMVFSNCGGYVITGGADGVINLWNLVSLVAVAPSSSSSSSSPDPIHTWSEHHLPVTDLHPLPSSRLVSIGGDRRAVLIELHSGQTIARIDMGHCTTDLRCVVGDREGRRLYMGGADGVIYRLDLDAYAMGCTAEGATLVSVGGGGRGGGRERDVSVVLGYRDPKDVLGMNEGVVDAAATTTTTTAGKQYVTELIGHERAVTCLAVLPSSENGSSGEETLVSGSEDGTVRIWDVRSRCCTRVVRPWTSSTSSLEMGSGNGGGDNGKGKGKGSKEKKKQAPCPCSTLTILLRDELTGGSSAVLSSPFERSKHTRGGSHRAKGEPILASLVRPLQRFPKERNPVSDFDRGGKDGGTEEEYVHCIIRPKRCVPSWKDDVSVPLFEGLWSLGQYIGNAENSSSLWMETEGTTTSNTAKTTTTTMTTPTLTSSPYPNKKLRVDKSTSTEDDSDGTDEDEEKKTTKPPSTKTPTKNTSTTTATTSPAISKDDNAERAAEAAAATARAEVERLRKKLDEAKETIVRWQKVNNKLIHKLKRAA